MKEIEAQILEHKDELMASTKKKKKKSKLEEAAAKAAGENTEAPEDGGEVLEAEGESTRWRTAKIWRSVQRTTSKNSIRRKVTAQHDHYHTGCP